MLFDIEMNELSENTIKGFFQTGRIPHAIIIEGTNDINRMKTARLIASAVLCQGENKPCGNCKSCEKIKNNVHPDVIICDKENDKATLGVDVVRKMKNDAVYSANDSEKKVYIFRQAQDMTVGSQNALLKIFEEPPDHVMIIITCSSKATLLETIISRGTLITLGESNEASENDGASKKAYEKAEELCYSLIRENELEFMKRTGVFEKDRKLFVEAMEYMKILFVSASVVKNGGKNILANEECAAALSTKFSLRQLMEFAVKIDAVSEQLVKNGNNNLCITRLSSLLANAKH